jgi:ABC-type branched-subunit amino acid transport system substrate-binding protein
MRFGLLAVIGAALTLAASVSFAAEKKYDVGATDTEIKIGQTMPYSGPASGYGTQGKTELAYWKMINSKGGINGRKVTLLTMDDSYSPPKTVEQTRNSSNKTRSWPTSAHWERRQTPRSKST